MRVNAQRLWQTHEHLESLTDKNHPYTRRAFTPLYKKSRKWLEDELKSLGLCVEYDSAGNLIGTYKGESDEYFAFGSHTDTVPSGGRFDGITGVLSALEVLKVFKESGYKPKKSIKLIDFLSEESSDFGLSCIGSHFATGNFTKDMTKLVHEKTNQPLHEAINEWGGDFSKLKQGKSLFDKNKIKGFLELHIEQGKVLESKNLDIGLVKGICSVTRYNFFVYGKAAHAGNTPMDMRSDPVVSAAKIIDEISNIAKKTLLGDIYFTATVGKVNVYPNGSNVIAKRVEFSLDIRCETNTLVEQNLQLLFEFVKKVQKETNTKVEYKKISQSTPSFSDEGLLNELENGAKKLGLTYMKILSGAGHDAAYMSEIAPMAMIFIPCKDGVSHSPDEYSTKEQIEKGANLLLESMVSLTS